MSGHWKWLSDWEAEAKLAIAHERTRLARDTFEARKNLGEIGGERILHLISVMKELREALTPFAKSAEWTSDDRNDTRACIWCDTGGAGLPTINGHDYDCELEFARETLARSAEGKAE